MKIIYKRSLTFIGFLIAICGFIGVAYLFYDKVISNETEVVVLGDLSINYIDGVKVSSNGTYSFSVTNSGTNDLYYEIIYDELKGYDSDIKYNLSSTEANVNVINASLEKDSNIIADTILIKTGATQNFTLTISNNTITSFKLAIKAVEDIEEYFYMTILSNNEIKKSPTTKIGESIATTNEGLIEDVDDYGTTYYFRGNVANNYVEFAGFIWRIVRINGDGTVKLVLNELTGELTNYNSKIDTAEDFENSTINKNLTTYYENNLKYYDEYIYNSKFCLETDGTTTDNEKVYNAYSRLMTNKIPTFNCLGTTYKSKIGLLTTDEVIYAGANFDEENTTYYLYNKKIESIWWTSNLAKSSSTEFFPFSVDPTGKIIDTTSGILYRGLRPTINLTKRVIVSGTGTINDPYTLASPSD